MSATLQTFNIAAAGTTVYGPVLTNIAARSLLLEAAFTYGSGGTTVDAYVQSSADSGATWYDIANFHFTTANKTSVFNLGALTPVVAFVTPGDGALSSDTSVDGILGDRLQLKIVTVGAYSGTALAVSVIQH